jgi:hypothetical protein
MPAGHRPPKRWFEQKLKEVKEGNPSYSDEQAQATVGKIWYGLSDYKQNQISKSHEGNAERRGTMLCSAIHRLADDENRIVYEKYGPGKFDDNVQERIYNDWADGAGDVDVGDEFFGLYSLMTYDPPLTVDYGDGDTEVIGGAILYENEQGFVYTDTYPTAAEAEAALDDLQKEYEDFVEQEESGDDDL